MKACPKCGEEKALENFGKDRKTKDGLRVHCKPCNKAYANRWQRANRDRAVLSSKKWMTENAERRRAYIQTYNIENRDKLNEQKRQYAAQNREMMRDIKRRSAIKNAAAVKRKNDRWKKNNIIKVRSYWAKRHAAKLKAMPPWLTEEHLARIESFFAFAREREKETGVPHHVDHIVPLQGDDFCGLHVPWNLCVLPAFENISKGNRLTKAAYIPSEAANA
jgi:hypothetical protein